MSTTTVEHRQPHQKAFRHEALFYRGQDELVAHAAEFVRDGLAADEPVLVALPAAKVAALKVALGADAESVCFAEMEDIGRNPARIIPVWHDFVNERGAGGRPVRGVGEPIWAGRTPAELAECARHEALLNLAFAEAPAFILLCPYDTASLDPEVLDEAARNHPVVVAADDGSRAESPIYRDLASLFDPFDDPLPPPPGSVQELAFDPDSLHRVRQFVYAQAARASVGAVRTSDLALAVHELATNSIRHGGGSGLLRAWQEGDMLLVEVRDAGWVKPPLVGRQRPGGQQEGGRGLWIVNQVCDLVQVRSSSKGTIVRIHMSPA